jgi:putative transcriptional regulator
MTATEWRHGEEEPRQPYHYTECGLDAVFLINGYEVHETPYGRGVSVKDVDGLHKAIGCWIANGKKALDGKEVRFLRKEMDLAQSEVGDILSVSVQTVARWEKGQCDMPGPAEIMLRVIYLQHIGGKINVRKLAEHLRSAENGPDSVEFTDKGGHWHATCRAA